jgi:hypothetical protein
MRILPVFLLLAAAAFGQTGVLKTFDFEKDTGDWTTMGGGGSRRVTHDPADVKNGAGALAFSYDLSQKGMAAAVIPANGSLGSMQRLRTWIKTDHDTAVAFLLSEKKPGGNYTAWVWAPANRWQQVDLLLAEFAVSDGPNDPVDPDGKLDADQIEGIAVIDLAFFFNGVAGNPDSPLVVHKSEGKHRLILDDFEVLTGPAKVRANPPGGVLVDAFDDGFSQWATLGGMKLELRPADNPLGEPALEASYETVEGRLSILTRRVMHMDLSKAKRLAFDVASDHEQTLAVSVELQKPGSSQGPRYTLTIFPPPGRKPFHVDVSLADFERDQNSPADSAGHLDPSRVKSITLTDITAMAGGEAGANRIWIGNFQVLP